MEPEPRSLLVVTKDRAVELADATTDGKTITGTVRGTWSVSTSLTRGHDETSEPAELAAALGWPRVTDAKVDSPASIDVNEVIFARVYEANAGQTTGAVLWGIASGAGVSALIGLLISLGALAGGRPLRVRGRRVLPPVTRGGDWTETLAPRPVPEGVRSILAHIWTEEARAEHSSVATFSKLSLELLALGAPPDLVVRANRAAMEEVEHARLCFALASAYRGHALGPGPLPEALSGDHPDIDRLARESMVDGCIGEAIAAEFARIGAQHAEDPAVARVLSIQARDEAQHAALAWSIVEWCLAQRGEPLRQVLVAALRGATLPRCYDLPEHGRMGTAEMAPRFEALRAAARERLTTGEYQAVAA